MVALMAFAVTASGADNKSDFTRKLQTFSSIIKELQTLYVDTLSGEEQMNNAIDIFLYQLDPYTEYYPRDNQDEILSISTGSYAGIGSAIVKRGDHVLISAPYYDSPARRSGLRAGDRILAIDGDTLTANADISNVSSRLRGQAGTTVHVDFVRPFAEDSLMAVDIVRENIHVNPLPYYGRLDNGVGYIRLTQFNESSARDVKAAVQDLTSGQGIPGLVLDLRGNGGGLLEGAVQIASIFVPKGTEIVRTRGRNPDDVRIYKTTTAPIAADLPLVILVDGGTASSSEIVAGSMQDLDRAVIVGTRTFGKGLVQTTRPLPGGDLLKLTTARYYMPSGRLIQALDYKHRNPDGSPGHTPDSLRNNFTTRAGRIVKDGGGITPDTVLTQEEPARLPYKLASDFKIFDFATRYITEHPQAPEPGTVLVDSLTFSEFVNSIDPETFKYNSGWESVLENLRSVARADGLLSDSVSEQIDALTQSLRRDLSADMEANRNKIVEMIDTEIASRYYPESETVRRSLPGDSSVQTAASIAADRTLYRNILTNAAH